MILIWPLVGMIGAGIINSLFDQERSRQVEGENRRNREAVDRANKENIAYQKEFAQHGLKWKIEDGRQAGLSPLASIGAIGPSFSPSIQAFQESGAESSGTALQDMGQNLVRSVASTMDSDQRTLAALQISSAQLDIEGKAIDNQIRASELRRMQLTGPPMPSPTDQTGGMSGQGNFKIKPSEAISSSEGAPHQQAGAITDIGFARTSIGGYIPVPSQDIKERIEDNMFHEATHFFRNNIIPNISGGNPPNPKQYPLPKGYDEWRWSHKYQQYMPARSRRLHWENQRKGAY